MENILIDQFSIAQTIWYILILKFPSITPQYLPAYLITGEYLNLIECMFLSVSFQLDLLNIRSNLT